MILIPQIYLKNGKVVILEGARSGLFQEDPLATVEALKDSGAEAIHCIDLGIPPVGQSPHLPIVERIRKEFGLSVYIDGNFKTAQGIEGFISAGAEVALIGSIAYQQPAFMEDVCKRFPGRIGVHIDVKAGRVTIPGYAVTSNKSSLDYAEQFLKNGVRHIFYSDVGPSGTVGEDNLKALLNFCRSVIPRVICTSEISSIKDIEKISRLGAPRLDGLVLAKSIMEGRVDLRSAITMNNDISLESGNEPTMTDM